VKNFIKKFTKNRWPYLIGAACFVLSFMLLPQAALAGIIGDTIADKATEAIGGLAMLTVNLLGSYILLPLINLVVWILSYNSFLDNQAVNIGWPLVRDLCNMFFVVLLLFIAFGTILNIPNYSYKNTFFKLILMAVLINFSKTIMGFAIDFMQVIMLTFVSAFRDAAAVNIIHAFGVRDMLKLEVGSENFSNWQVTGKAILAVFLLVVAIGLMLAYAGVLLWRIISLWVLVILSPLAFLLTAVPAGQKYATEIWTKFTEQLTTGVTLAFFMWLFFSVLSAGYSPEQQTTSASLILSSDAPANVMGSAADRASVGGKAVISQDIQWERLYTFIIAVALLFLALDFAKKAGGLGGGLAGKFSNKLSDIGTKGLGLAKKGAGLGLLPLLGGGSYLARRLSEKLPGWANPAALIRGFKERKKELHTQAQAQATAKGREAVERFQTGGWKKAFLPQYWHWAQGKKMKQDEWDANGEKAVQAGLKERVDVETRNQVILQGVKDAEGWDENKRNAIMATPEYQQSVVEMLNDAKEGKRKVLTSEELNQEQKKKKTRLNKEALDQAAQEKGEPLTKEEIVEALANAKAKVDEESKLTPEEIAAAERAKVEDLTPKEIKDLEAKHAGKYLADHAEEEFKAHNNGKDLEDLKARVKADVELRLRPQEEAKVRAQIAQKVKGKLIPGHVKIPYLDKAEEAFEAQYAKEFHLMTKEEIAQQAFLLKDIGGAEGKRRRRALLKVAGSKGFLDDIIMSDNISDSYGYKDKDGNKVHDYKALNHFLHSYVGFDKKGNMDEQGQRLIYDLEDIGKGITHSEYAGHNGYNANTGKYEAYDFVVPGQKYDPSKINKHKLDAALNKRASEEGKSSGQVRSGASPHVIMQLLDRMGYDKHGNLVKGSFAGDVDIDSAEDRAFDTNFRGQRSQDLQRYFQQRMALMAMGGRSSDSNVGLDGAHVGMMDVGRIAQMYHKEANFIQIAYDKAGGVGNVKLNLHGLESEKDLDHLVDDILFKQKNLIHPDDVAEVKKRLKAGYNKKTKTAVINEELLALMSGRDDKSIKSWETRGDKQPIVKERPDKIRQNGNGNDQPEPGSAGHKPAPTTSGDKPMAPEERSTKEQRGRIIQTEMEQVRNTDRPRYNSLRDEKKQIDKQLTQDEAIGRHNELIKALSDLTDEMKKPDGSFGASLRKGSLVVKQVHPMIQVSTGNILGKKEYQDPNWLKDAGLRTQFIKLLRKELEASAHGNNELLGVMWTEVKKKFRNVQDDPSGLPDNAISDGEMEDYFKDFRTS